MSQLTSWDPASYAANARFVSDLGEPLLHLLDAKKGEVILDLGCGDGALTEKIAAFGCTVYGVDTSYPQIQAARKRGLKVLVMDGHRLGLRQSIDAVLSNAALHWIKEPEQVARGVCEVLKCGGRFIGEFGGKGNVETIRSALHAGLLSRGIDPLPIDPWYNPSTQEYSNLLTSCGFKVTYIELIPRPTRLPGDMLGWLEIFAQPFTQAVAEPDREQYLRETRDEVKASLRDSEGRWFADYARLRFKASKEPTVPQAAQ
jgi:trans-aconitate methyltransferase